MKRRRPTRFMTLCAAIAGGVSSCNLIAGMPEDPAFGDAPGGALNAGDTSAPAGGGGSEVPMGGGGLAGRPETGSAGADRDAAGSEGTAAGAGSSGGAPDAGVSGSADRGGAGDSGGSGGAPDEDTVLRLPGSPASQLPVTVVARKRASTARVAGDVDVFWIGENGGVRHTARAGEQFGPVSDLEGAPVLAPLAVSSANDALSIFIVDDRGRVFGRRLVEGSWQAGGRDAWLALGSGATRAISAVADAAGNTDLYAVDVEGRISTLSLDPELAPRGPWLAIEGAIADGGVAATRRAEGFTDLFIRSGGRLVTKWHQHGAWGPSGYWMPIPVCNDDPQGCPCRDLDADPVALATNPNRVDVIFSSAGLFHTWWEAGLGWRCETTRFTAGAVPSLVLRETDRFDVFATGPERAVYFASYGGNKWDTLWRLEAPFSELAAASSAPEFIVLFGRTSERIGYVEWSQSTGFRPSSVVHSPPASAR